MSRLRHALLAVVMVGCSTVPPVQKPFQNASIDFVPKSAWSWPLLAGPDGWLIGGSGYTTGFMAPWPVMPAVGLGLALVPSRHVGSWFGLPGDIPMLLPPIVPNVIWEVNSPLEQKLGALKGKLGELKDKLGDLHQVLGSDSHASPSEREAAAEKLTMASDVLGTAKKFAGILRGPNGEIIKDELSHMLLAMIWPDLMARLMPPVWTKIGPHWVPGPIEIPWPKKAPYWFTPWGPIKLENGPLDEDNFLLGFPTADGTPESGAVFIPWFQRREGRTISLALDLVSRTLYRPPNLIPLDNPALPDDPIIFDVSPGIFLICPLVGPGRIALIDALSGGIDPLPELPRIEPRSVMQGARMSQFAQVVAFEDGTLEHQRVHIFDRRTRYIDRLERMNFGDGDNFDPAIDWYARKLAFVTNRFGNNDIYVYDLITGLYDPLPGVNTEGDESSPFLAAQGRWMVYVTTGTATGLPQARLYDPVTGGIDPLPDVNRLGIVVGVFMTPAGQVIIPLYIKGGQLRVAAYIRNTGFIDPLPELNPPGVNMLPLPSPLELPDDRTMTATP